MLQVVEEYLTGGFCGFDKEGSPVRVELFGYLDMKGIMYSSRKIDLEKTKILQCETTVRDWETQSKKVPTPHHRGFLGGAGFGVWSS